MALTGQAALAMTWDVDPASDTDFNEWHHREHFPERLALPGWLRGRRFTAIDCHPRYLTIYEAATLECLRAPAYLERLNHPTEWSRRVLTAFVNTRRNACRVTHSTGRLDGAVIGAVELMPAPGKEENLRGALTSWLDSALDYRGLVATHLLEPDPEASRVESEEQKLRSSPDAVSGWIMLLESIDESAVWEAYLGFRTGGAPVEWGAQHMEPLRTYRFAFGISRTPPDLPCPEPEGQGQVAQSPANSEYSAVATLKPSHQVTRSTSIRKP